MKQFEYDRRNFIDNGSMISCLDTMGKESWEVISIFKSDKHHYEIFFKREIPNDEKT